MKRPIQISAMVVISLLPFIGCAPAMAQGPAYPRQRIKAGLSGNFFTDQPEYVDYARGYPRRTDEWCRPDDRERHRRHHHRHHERRRVERVKVVGVVKVTGPQGDQPERVERMERVEIRRME